MDAFEIDSVKSEKAMAMRRYRRFRQIAGVFRCVEVFVAFVLLAWISLRLPLVVRISGEFFRQLVVVLVSPRFVFLVGNAIVITLFAKSGQFSARASSASGAGAYDLYDEFLKNSENRGTARAAAEEDVVVQDKLVCEEKKVVHKSSVIGESAVAAAASAAKVYRRSRSEVPAVPMEKMPRLRRSETDAGQKAEEERRSSTYSEAEMSNEEFRRTIEKFIAKQLKFQREESMAIVPHSHS